MILIIENMIYDNSDVFSGRIKNIPGAILREEKEIYE